MTSTSQRKHLITVLTSNIKRELLLICEQLLYVKNGYTFCNVYPFLVKLTFIIRFTAGIDLKAGKKIKM